MPRITKGGFLERIHNLFAPSPRPVALDFDDRVQLVHEIKPIRRFYMTELPAAGAQLSHTFQMRLRILSMWTLLQTDATVSNRIMEWLLRNASGEAILYWEAAFNQTASLAIAYAFAHGLNRTTALPVTTATDGFPRDLEVETGWVLSTNVINLQAGDQVLQHRMIVEEL